MITASWDDVAISTNCVALVVKTESASGPALRVVFSDGNEGLIVCFDRAHYKDDASRECTPTEKRNEVFHRIMHRCNLL